MESSHTVMDVKIQDFVVWRGGLAIVSKQSLTLIPTYIFGVTTLLWIVCKKGLGSDRDDPTIVSTTS